MAENRRKDGTFARGVSGNPNGRPRKQAARIRMPASVRRAIFEVAEMPVDVRGPEGPMETTVAKAVLQRMASDALKGNAAAQWRFMTLLNDAASRHNEQIGYVQEIAADNERLHARIDYLTSLMPQVEGGVMLRRPDGRLVRNAFWRPEDDLDVPEPEGDEG